MGESSEKNNGITEKQEWVINLGSSYFVANIHVRFFNHSIFYASGVYTE
jgi:hypothetical protein